MKRDAQTVAQLSAQAMWGENTTSQTLGMRIEEVGPGFAVLSMSVASTMVNGHGYCHGGYIFALTDSAFAFAATPAINATSLSIAISPTLRPAVWACASPLRRRSANAASAAGSTM